MSRGNGELPPVIPTEKLGRRVFDGNKADRADKRGDIVPKIFREKDGVLSLSVDRLDHAPLQEMVRLGYEDARSRGRSGLRGWAALTAHDAAQNGRTVEFTPLLENRYHASIHLI